MPEQPVIARRTPCIVEIDPGTVYKCQCGRSKTLPFRDGSHTGTMFSPMEIYFEEKYRVAFCDCSRQKSLPSATGLTRESNRLRKNYWAQQTFNGLHAYDNRSSRLADTFSMWLII